jgi:hypothetical protein
MKIFIVGLLLLVLFVGASQPAYSKKTEFERLDDEFFSLYQQGSYDQAVVVATKIQKSVEKK